MIGTTSCLRRVADIRRSVRQLIVAGVFASVAFGGISDAAASTTLKSGRWFPHTVEFDPQRDSYIWDGTVPVGNGSVADIFHDVTLVNFPDEGASPDELPDDVSSITVGSVNLHSGSSLTLLNDVLGVGTGMHSEIVGNSGWQGGTLADSVVPGSIGQRGTLSISGTRLHDVDIENTNRIRILGDTEIVFATINNVSHVSPDPSVAILEFDGDGDILYNSGTGAIFNRGLVLKSGGLGVSVIEAPFHNFGSLPNNMAGTIEVQTGTLVLQGTGDYDGGHFVVSAGAILDLTGGAGGLTHRYTGTFTASGNGAVRLNSGQITANHQNVTFDFSGSSFQWSGGRLNTAGTGSSITNTDTVNIVDGTEALGIRVNLINQGTVNHTRVALPIEMISAGVVDNFGLWDIQGDGDYTNLGGDFNNQASGTFRKSSGSGTSEYAAVFNNLGTVEVRAGTLHFTGATPQTTGTTLTGGTWIVDDGTLIVGQRTLTTNQGSVTLQGGNSLFAQIDSLANNQGTFRLRGGRDFNTAGNLTNSGLVSLGKDSVLTVNGTYTQTASGRLNGRGKLVAATVTNGGVLAPGESPGLFEIEGNLVQQASSTLEIELGGYLSGEEFDQLIVTGQAILAGQLVVNLINGFAPQLGDTFDILMAGSTQGQFTYDSPLFNGSPLFEVLYDLPGRVSLRALQTVPEPLSIVTAVVAYASLLLVRRRS